MLLVAVLVFCLFACGSDDDKEPAETDDSPDTMQDGGVSGTGGSTESTGGSGEPSESGTGGSTEEMLDASVDGAPVTPPEPPPDLTGILDDYSAPTDPDEETDPLPPLPIEKTLPIVFVHGYAGSGEQYQSHAMRWVANGYPIERIRAYDHHGGMSGEDFVVGLDELIDDVLDEFSESQVFLVGHSRGTGVSNSYLSDPARASKVAKYVSVDGTPCPADFDCINIRAVMFPPQTHVEVCTSPESFFMQYEFFMGEEPEVVHIVRQKGMVEISGRAVNFPANTGRDSTTLEVYEIDSDTGARETEDPLYTAPISEDGNWGPFEVDPKKHYEMTLIQEDGEREHHFYPQPFLRDTRLVRLLSGGSDSDTRVNTNSGDNHATLIAIRMREWHESTDPDILEISTQSESGNQDPVNAIVSGITNGNIAIHIHDDAATPGETTLAPLPYFTDRERAFQYGVDVFMPAADPPDGTITVKNIPRGDTSKPQVLNAANWASSKHAITVMFTDFPQL